MTETTAKPLDGITILDFTRVLAGPYCTAMLADQGATVIKVEAPQGDDQRAMGAFRDGRSLSFELINRNKRSLRLDLHAPEGRAIAAGLAARADVVIENFRPGVADRLGIGAAALRAAHPQLIHCSISGFGQSGPMAQMPSYDVIAQALSGLMSITGAPEGDSVLVGDSVGDILAGIYAAQAICAALFQRERTGAGATIDVAMFDALFSLLPTALAIWQRDGTPPARAGANHPLSAPFGAYRTADGRVMIAVGNTSLFGTLCAAMGRVDLTEDPRFSSDQSRKANADALREQIEAWSCALPAAEVVRILGAAGVPVSPVWTVDQAAESAQVAARGLLHAVDHPERGRLMLPEQPVHFAGSPRGTPCPAPDLGADGPAILHDILGLPQDEITHLRAADII